MGDSEGHPFHGNQYSGDSGSGGERRTVERTVVTPADLARTKELAKEARAQGAHGVAHELDKRAERQQAELNNPPDRAITKPSTAEPKLYRVTSAKGPLVDTDSLEVAGRALRVIGKGRTAEPNPELQYYHPGKQAYVKAGSLTTRVMELTLAVTSLGERHLEFGDLPGHPFRGNQHTTIELQPDDLKVGDVVRNPNTGEDHRLVRVEPGRPDDPYQQWRTLHVDDKGVTRQVEVHQGDRVTVILPPGKYRGTSYDPKTGPSEEEKWKNYEIMHGTAAMRAKRYG